MYRKFIKNAAVLVSGPLSVLAPQYAAAFAAADAVALDQSEDASAADSWPEFERQPLATAQLPMPKAALRIDWSSDDNVPSETSKAACANLGSYLRVGHGPWGLGYFESISCYLNGQHAGGPQISGAPWRLTVAGAADNLSMVLRFAPAGIDEAHAGVVAAAISMQAQPTTPGFLARDKLLAAALAAAILDALPAATSDAQPAVKTPEDRALAARMPKAMTYFQLRFLPEEGLWRAAAPQPQAPVAGQNAAGRGTQVALLIKAAEQRQKRLREAFATADNSASSLSMQRLAGGAGDLLERATLANVAKGYVGVRYGRELINPKDAVLPPSNLFGLLAEFRAGPLQGVRIYYDNVPKVPSSTAGQQLFLSWDRTTVGWGFGYAPPCPTYLGRCRVELAPKAGVWNVDAQLPLATPEGNTEVAQFSARRLFSVGVEASAELDTRWTLWRPWVARDTSFGAFNQKIKSNVSLTRFGLDTFIKLPARDIVGPRTSLALLVFAFQDSLELNGTIHLMNAAGESNSSLDGQTAKLGVSTTYGGAGVTVAW